MFQRTNLCEVLLEQAAEDLYDKCKPGRRNEISVTPMPCSVTVNPSGGMLFRPASAEIYVDGTLAGSGGVPMLLPAGKYRIEVKAPGYKVRSFDCQVEKDAVFNVNLEK